MIKVIMICLAFIFISNQACGQDKIYNLITKTKNADINYKAFKKFDDLKIYRNNGIEKAFKPIKGRYDTYFFISEFEGSSFDGTKKLFHDYLILKVEPKSQNIIDGFQYTLEWAEPPAISDLYQVTQKHFKIGNDFEIDSLKMELVESEYMIEWRKRLDPVSYTL